MEPDPSIAQGNTVATTQQSGVKWRFPAIHPEGRKFGAIAAGVTLLFLILHWHVLAWLMAGLTIWVFAFFRDPVRVTPIDADALVAPADGEPVEPTYELDRDAWYILYCT